jgi:hypothetical protein
MKESLLSLALGLVLTSGTVWAADSGAPEGMMLPNKADPNVLTLKDASPEETVLFLGGAAMGIGYTNAQLVVEHKEELFCSPPNFQLGARTLYDAAAVQLKGPQEPGTIIIAGLDTLKKRSPCK